MHKKSGKILGVCCLLLANACVVDGAQATNSRLARLTVGEVTRAPLGWSQFCAEHPHECRSPAVVVQEAVLSPAKWKELLRINDLVNEQIQPLTDLEHYGVVEKWTYPEDGYGDCEDYVLLKRRLLADAGWPLQALLITVVRDHKGEGHAVLTVKTNKGDFILDNQETEVLRWSETNYRYVKRQSQSDPNVWVLLGDPRPAVATAAAR